mmetsp:Transcript_8448/g.52839  ORF Transcript_8448/g.52839 Transcript_8448/m.52839 type:complete len:85 (+) Transcript_8448:1127-1381(+)
MDANRTTQGNIPTGTSNNMFPCEQQSTIENCQKQVSARRVSPRSPAYHVLHATSQEDVKQAPPKEEATGQSKCMKRLKRYIAVD